MERTGSVFRMFVAAKMVHPQTEQPVPPVEPFVLLVLQDMGYLVIHV